jgi:hypothetical protein
MAGKGKIEPRWQKGESGNPNGRPKRSFTLAIENGFTKEDVTNCYKLYICC